MRGAARFVDWTLRHRRLLWAVALLIAVPSILRTAWLYAHLRSDLEELLPRQSPSVVALEELKRRVVGYQYLAVVVDGGSKENIPAAEHLLDAVAARARSYPPGLLTQIRDGREAERRFIDERGGLYVSLVDLRTLRTRVETGLDYAIARETGTLLDENQPPPHLDFHDIRAHYEERLGHTGEKSGSRFTNEELHTSVLLLQLGEYSSGSDVSAKVLHRVQADVEAIRASGNFPAEMRVGYAGDAAIAAEELSALVTDVSKSSVIVVLAVMLAIIAYYHWWRSVLVVIPPLLVALVCAFAVASLPPFSVKVINSNTAFLASIIVGNGINFALILLSRYVEERRRGLDVRAALELAVAGSRAGTLAAAAAASVSYAALAITQFQGFRQFGFIGGMGMIFAWGAAFLLMPSLIAHVDRSDATRPRPIVEHRRISFWVARAVHAAPRLILTVSIVLTVIAAIEVSHFRSSDIETDFSRLRRRDTWISGEGYWGARMNDVLGQYLTPLAFLTDNPDQARALGAALHRAVDHSKLSESIEEVRTIDDVLPTDQPRKLIEIKALREDLRPSVRAALDPEAARYVDLLLSGGKRPVTLEQLPPSFTLGLRERDGTVGRIVLVYPRLSKHWWDADEMAQFVASLRQIAHDSVPGNPPRLAGAIPLSSDITQAVRHDGPLACFAAFVGVVVMVLFLLRRTLASAYVIGALVVGVAWMAGTSHLIGVKINFTNFIAFPITFGIGVDYAANVISRYEKDGATDILAAVRSTGAAVALCSLTTIIGYSSLLMAENRALFLFGLLAVLGEASCLTVALVSLPSFIIWLRAHSRAARASPRRITTGTHAPGRSR